MRIDVRNIITEVGSSQDINISFKPSDIEITDEDCVIDGEVLFDGTVVSANNGLILLKGILKANVKTQCDRCGEPFIHKLKTDVDLYWSPKLAKINVEEDNSLEEIYTYDGKFIVLDRAFRDTILLGIIPEKILCTEGCKGTCYICGQNLNKANCDCLKKTDDDSPFRKLKKLL